MEDEENASCSSILFIHMHSVYSSLFKFAVEPQKKVDYRKRKLPYIDGVCGWWCIGGSFLPKPCVAIINIGCGEASPKKAKQLKRKNKLTFQIEFKIKAVNLNVE